MSSLPAGLNFELPKSDDSLRTEEGTASTPIETHLHPTSALALNGISIEPVAEQVAEQPADTPITSAPITTRRRRRRGESQSSVEIDPVKVYLDQIGHVPLLTKDDEARLAQAREKGLVARDELTNARTAAQRRQLKRQMREGEDAERQFIEANLRLVVSIARRYQASGLALLDIIQEGNLGLMHAVEKFDWRKGFKFSTYATWWIRQSITRGIANTDRTIRIPIHAREQINRLDKCQKELRDRGVEDPTIAELAANSGFSEQRVIELLSYPSRSVSLHQPIGGEGEGELMDVLSDPNATDEIERMIIDVDSRETIEKITAGLTEEELDILRQRFGINTDDPLALTKLGEHFGYSGEWARNNLRIIYGKIKQEAADIGLL